MRRLLILNTKSNLWVILSLSVDTVTLGSHVDTVTLGSQKWVKKSQLPLLTPPTTLIPIMELLPL